MGGAGVEFLGRRWLAFGGVVGTGVVTLQKSMLFTPLLPRAGPTGGEGEAWPAPTISLTIWSLARALRAILADWLWGLDGEGDATDGFAEFGRRFSETRCSRGGVGGGLDATKRGCRGSRCDCRAAQMVPSRMDLDLGGGSDQR